MSVPFSGSETLPASILQEYFVPYCHCLRANLILEIESCLGVIVDFHVDFVANLPVTLRLICGSKSKISS